MCHFFLFFTLTAKIGNFCRITISVNNTIKISKSKTDGKWHRRYKAGYNPTPAGYNPTPAGYNPTPAGYNPTPAGYNPTPAGYNPTPAGLNNHRNGKPPPCLCCRRTMNGSERRAGYRCQRVLNPRAAAVDITGCEPAIVYALNSRLTG